MPPLGSVKRTVLPDKNEIQLSQVTLIGAPQIPGHIVEHVVSPNAHNGEEI
jgi:hypothetical protein